MMRATLLLLLLLGGCTSVFGLESPTRQVPVEDAELPIDMLVPDGTPSCSPVVYDEDDDGIADACDACPTIASDANDADGDGLPNACDQDLGPNGDRILFARMFTSPSEINDLQPNNATQGNENRGVVEISGGRLRLATALTATLVEVRVLGFVGDDHIEIKVANATCGIEPEPCSGSGVGMCVQLSTSSIDLAAPTGELRRVLLLDTGGGARCDVTASAGQAGAVSGPSALGTGDTEIKVGLGSTMVLQSLVIYGAN